MIKKFQLTIKKTFQKTGQDEEVETEVLHFFKERDLTKKVKEVYEEKRSKLAKHFPHCKRVPREYPYIFRMKDRDRNPTKREVETRGCFRDMMNDDDFYNLSISICRI